MITAFQPDAFQWGAYQIGTLSDLESLGGKPDKKRRKNDDYQRLKELQMQLQMQRDKNLLAQARETEDEITMLMVALYLTTH